MKIIFGALGIVAALLVIGFAVADFTSTPVPRKVNAY
jgi:hypothetical protein